MQFHDIIKCVKSKSGCDYGRQLLNSLSEISSEINEKDEDGWTPLMFATDNGDYETVKLLIEYGADVNIQNCDGETALIISVICNSKRISSLLVKSGADINIKNNWGRDALMFAADFDFNKIGQNLLLNGANMDATDNQGNTAYDIARKKWAFKKNTYFLCEKINPEALFTDRFRYFFLDFIQRYNIGSVLNILDIKDSFMKKYNTLANVSFNDSMIISCIDDYNQRHFEEKKLIIGEYRNIIIYPSDTEVENFISSVIHSEQGDFFSISISTMKSNFEKKYHIPLEDTAIISCVKKINREEVFGKQNPLTLNRNYDCIYIYPSDTEVENFISSVIHSEQGDFFSISISTMKSAFEQKYHMPLEDSSIASCVKKINQSELFGKQKVLTLDWQDNCIYFSSLASEIENFISFVIHSEQNDFNSDSISINTMKSAFEKRYYIPLEDSAIISCIEKFNRGENWGKQKVLILDLRDNCIYISSLDSAIEKFVLFAINSEQEAFCSISISTMKSAFEKKYHIHLEDSAIISWAEKSNQKQILGKQKILELNEKDNRIYICPSELEIENFISSAINSEQQALFPISINTLKSAFEKKYHIPLEDSTIISCVEKFNREEIFGEQKIIMIDCRNNCIYIILQETKKLSDFIISKNKPFRISSENLKRFGNYDLSYINLMLKKQNLVLRLVSNSSCEYIVTFNDIYSHSLEFDAEISLFLRKLFLSEIPGFSSSIAEIKNEFYKEYDIEMNDDNIYASLHDANYKLLDLQIVEEGGNSLKSEFKNSSSVLFRNTGYNFECCICHEKNLSKYDFPEHIRKHSSYEKYCSILQITDKELYYCNHCQKKISLRYALTNRHILGICKDKQ